jgi:hypothetical protein
MISWLVSRADDRISSCRRRCSNSYTCGHSVLANRFLCTRKLTFRKGEGGRSKIDCSGCRLRVMGHHGYPSVAQLIARSMAEPPSKSKNAKTWAMPSKAPSASPKPTLLRAKQRKGLETIPQSRPIRVRRIICFTEPPSKVNHLAFGVLYQCSVLR